MSLLLHYPLNGDLTNKGILNKCGLVQNLSDNQVGFVNGKLGKSAWFDTVANRYLKTSHSCNQILEDGSPFTLVAWFYLDNLPIDYSHKTGIVGCNNWRGKGIGIGILETGKIVFHYDSSTESKELSSTMNVVAGEWYHVACTYDGSIMKIYINGVLDST